MISPHSRGENKLRAFFRPRSRQRTADNTMAIHSDPPSSYHKASARPQNRPISSTTTATHSTITPLPSDVRLNGARHTYSLHPHSMHSLQDLDHPDVTEAHDQNDLPSEPPPSKPRLLLHSLFGISLTRRSSPSTSTPQQSASASISKGSASTSASLPAKSSRKRSFRLTSRPTTPKSVDDASSSKSPYTIPVPSSPLPLSASPRRRSFGLANSQRSTPKSSTSNLPLPQAPQCSRSHARRHSVGSERPPHDSAVALSEESSHRGLHKGALAVPDGGFRNKGKGREKPLPECPSINFPSQSLPTDPSPIAQNLITTHTAFSHLPTVDSVSSEDNDRSSLLVPHRLPAIPRIIHTPPTPQRAGEVVDSPARLGAVDTGKTAPAKPKTVTIARQEQVIISSSQSYPDQQPSKGRFTPRIFSGKDLPKIKDSNGHQSRGRQPDTSTHNVSTLARNMTNHRSKLGSFDFERPVSALNRSNSTLGRHGSRASRDNSPYTKSHLHSLERTISEDSAQGAKSHSNAHQSEQAEIQPVHTGETSVISFSSVSVQTMSTGKGMASTTPAGQSSSWGRTSGRRILRTSHGTFAFEHPLSAPSSPNPQNVSLSNQADGQLSTVLPSKSKAPLHTIFDTRTKHSRGQSYNTPDSIEPSYPKRPERKAKGKGRSLDLGLGLSWAPSRVREEVLMPGPILAREKAKLEKSKAKGSDVTKVFESILSESRFETFKEYVHRFDAHIIPLEGPLGLLSRVENLLAESGLSERERNKLISDFKILVEDHSG